MRKITLQGEFADLNTHDNANRRNRFAGSKLKKEETDRVAWELCKEKPIPKSIRPIHIDFIWHCKNKKKDKDNVAFAKKYIFDGMVKAGLLPNDGWNEIEDWTDSFQVSNEPKVELLITKP